MIQSMTTGHDGSLSTVHANDTHDAVSRLEMLASMSAGHLPMRFIQRLITSAVHVIVHCERLSGGARKVMQISEIIGTDGDAIQLQDLFKFEQTGMGPNRMAQGNFLATGIQPRCLSRMESQGIQLPAAMFERRVLEANA